MAILPKSATKAEVEPDVEQALASPSDTTNSNTVHLPISLTPSKETHMDTKIVFRLFHIHVTTMAFSSQHTGGLLGAVQKF